MTLRFLSDMSALLDRLSEDFRVVAPVRADEGGLHLQPYSSGTSVVVGEARSVQPLKTFLFPPRERVARYGVGSMALGEPPAEELAVVGAAACDLRSLRVLDAVFLDGDERDPFYEARRSRLLVISADCTEPRQTCFCTMLGETPYPSGGFDINLTPVDGGFLVEAGTDRGRRIVEANAELFSDPGEDAASRRESIRRAAEGALDEAAAEYTWGMPRKELLRRTEHAPVWTEAARDCVECAACLFGCPTCHCFLLHDHRAESGFERLRSWDACAYAGFARVAGGATPRARIAERFQHRYRHKFEYFLDRYGFEACTGCGRCIEACPGGIDMREVLSKAEEAA